jgi:hypothetical protein
MAGIEEAFEKFVTRVSGREKSRAEQPLSKYKSYSEQELLENIEAKYPNQLQSFSQEDYQLNTMPMFEPKDVAPPKSYSPMPVEKYLKGREYMDLAEGGLSNLIKNNIAPEYRLYTRTMVPGLKTGKLDENYFPDDFKLDLRKQALDKYSKTGELSGIVDEMDQHASRTKKNKLIRFPSTYAALGTYSYEIDPKTLDVKVKDKYDWNPAYGTQGNFTGFVGNEPEKGGRDVDASILKDYAVNTMKRGIDIPAGLELFGNLLGPRSSKGEGVDIDINIPTELSAMRADTPYADGGVASMFRERPGYQVGGTIDPMLALQRSPIDQYGYSDPVISALTGNIFTSGQRFRDVFSPQAGLMMQQAQAAGYSEPEMEELRLQHDFFPSFQRSLNEAYFGPTFQADPQKSAIDLATSIYNQRFQAPPSIQQPNQQTVQQQILQQAQQPQMSYNEMQKADYARRMGELENKFAKQGTSATKYIQDMTNLLAQMKTSGGIDPLGAMQSKYYTGPSSGSVSEGRGIDANFVINRAQQSEREAAARVTPTRMADGGRVSMSEGGLTTTVPPAKGPDSQGVESLFRRRYS